MRVLRLKDAESDHPFIINHQLINHQPSTMTRSLINHEITITSQNLFTINHHDNILRHPFAGRQVTLMPAGNDFAMFRNSCPDAVWMLRPLPELSRGPKRRSRWRRRLRIWLPTEWGPMMWSMCGHVHRWCISKLMLSRSHALEFQLMDRARF